MAWAATASRSKVVIQTRRRTPDDMLASTSMRVPLRFDFCVARAVARRWRPDMTDQTDRKRRRRPTPRPVPQARDNGPRADQEEFDRSVLRELIVGIALPELSRRLGEKHTTARTPGDTSGGAAIKTAGSKGQKPKRTRKAPSNSLAMTAVTGTAIVAAAVPVVIISNA